MSNPNFSIIFNLYFAQGQNINGYKISTLDIPRGIVIYSLFYLLTSVSHIMIETLPFFLLWQITVQRGKNGFGFSFIDELPPRVGRVDRGKQANCCLLLCTTTLYSFSEKETIKVISSANKLVCSNDDPKFEIRSLLLRCQPWLLILILLSKLLSF